MAQEKATAFGKPFSALALRVLDAGYSARAAGYRILTPLDYAFRATNRLKQYPPLHLRRYVGGMSSGFNGTGYEFVAYLRLLAGLHDGDSLWDLACGCGMLELALEDMGWRGKLTGTDVSRPCIDWAQKNIGTRVAGDKFVHMDIYSEGYQRTGKLTTKDWLDGFSENKFDVVIAKSLFTHLLPDEQIDYLKGIADRLNPGGKALLTFYVLSENQARLSASGKNRMSFQTYGDDERCAVYSHHNPHDAVAYRQEYLEERFRDAGFKTQSYKFYPGAWTGNSAGYPFRILSWLGSSPARPIGKSKYSFCRSECPIRAVRLHL